MGICCSSPVRVTQAPLNAEEQLPTYVAGDKFVCMPDGKAIIRYATEGVGSVEQCPAKTLLTWFHEAVERHGNKPAMKIERPIPALSKEGRAPPALPEEEWMTWTFSEYLADVKAAAKGFIKLGFQTHDAVNIWGFNSPEWVIAAYAAVFAGGKTAGLYPTDTSDTAAYKVAHSGGSIVMVEDEGKLKKLTEGISRLKRLRGKDGEEHVGAKRIRAIVAYGFEPDADAAVDLKGCGTVRLLGWKALLEMGRAESDAEMEGRQETIDAGHCACVIYTSGTTGDPKAVMISHDNIAFQASSVRDNVMSATTFLQGADQERVFSYLPLSHVAGMLLDIVSPIVATASSDSWLTIYFARPYDLKIGTFKDRLRIARPTVFMGVPLVWEKIADKLKELGANNPYMQKKMGNWAKRVASTHFKSRQLGEQPVHPCGLSVAQSLLNKVKRGLGLDACKSCMTGAAPIREDTLAYFGSLGFTINEIYGMSESSGVTTISSPAIHQWGSCGHEIAGAVVKAFKVGATINDKTECPRANDLEDLSEDAQGELCFRGRHIMMGYMCQPDFGEAHVEEIINKTKETIDNEGWLHSGDKGMITNAGMCKITGRYKELIIGEGGENIAPVPIEDFVKKTCDGICEIMMIGDKRKYNVALVTLKAEGANGDSPGTDELAAGALRVNPDVTTISEAMKDEVWIKAVTDAIAAANNNGRICFNNTSKIQKFTILPHNFSEDAGELTPTKKLKRASVERLYQEIVDKMYATAGVYIPFY